MKLLRQTDQSADILPQTVLAERSISDSPAHALGILSAAGHEQVSSRVRHALGGGKGVNCAAVLHSGDHPVCHDKALKAELTAENIPDET